MNYLNEINYKYLCEGLTYQFQDWLVLDQILTEFNKKNQDIDRIVEANTLEGFSHKLSINGPEQIFSLNIFLHPSKGKLCTADVMSNSKNNGVHPQLHLNLHSPSLDVPQRIEIPLKYVLKGLPALKGKHMVYLHAICLSNGSKYVYYGRTKRGWMKRFYEHVKNAIKGSHRKFPLLFGNAIFARYNQLLKITEDCTDLVYIGSHHVVCSAGLDKDTAIQVEHYLINNYSLGFDHGLNMI